MSDSLSVSFSVVDSFVQSQTPIGCLLTVTDTSDTPRAWTLLEASVLPPPGGPMIGGDFLPNQQSQTVPPGGSLKLSVGVVFFVQQQGNVDPISAQYDLTAAILTEDDYATGASGPHVTITTATAVPSGLPVQGQLDFRSNKRSVLGLTLLTF